MKIINSINEIQLFSRNACREGKTIAVVPTMGFLHEGHLSLIDIAKKSADIVIITIFINPTQFAPNEDFSQYPRSMENDLELCEQRTTDCESVIFAPTAKEMYPEDSSTWVIEDQLGKGLCGEARPSHFKGVTTVVAKLFNATLPDIAVFGQKDAQQAAIIKRMVRDLNFPIEIIIGPIVREIDGLAMSSRNTYLSENEKKNALSISRSLFHIKKQFDSNKIATALEVDKFISDEIRSSTGVLDYIEIVNNLTLEKIYGEIKSGTLIAVAVRYGKTRLIDNIVLTH